MKAALPILLLSVLVGCADPRALSSGSKDQPPLSQGAPVSGAAPTFIEGTWRQDCQGDHRRATIVFSGSIYHRTVTDYGTADCSGAPVGNSVDYTTMFKINSPDDDSYTNSLELWDPLADTFWFREDFLLDQDTDGRLFLNFSTEQLPGRYFQVK